MPLLTRQNGCHFYWDQGPPKHNHEAWTWTNMPPQTLHIVLHNMGVNMTYSQMCTMLTSDIMYSAYCQQWQVQGVELIT